MAQGENIFHPVASTDGDNGKTSHKNITTSPPRPSSHFEVIDGNLYRIDENKDLFNHEVLRQSKGLPSSRITVSTSGDKRQKEIWDFVSTFDSYKTSASYKVTNGKPTLDNFKYIILPVWWSDLDTSDNQLKMDPDEVKGAFIYNKQYYIDMSWGKMPNGVTFEITDQQLLTISSVAPGFDNTNVEAQKIVDDMGYKEFIDYNGVAMMYFVAQSGPFSGAGGWASVNDRDLWFSYPGWGGVTRHEVGHNFGHPHHLSVSYEHRQGYFGGETGEGTIPYDGYDMMSGGNHYDISEFAAASQWFFNWIPDSSIISMQPEGSTTECPSCSSSGTFTLRPFDNKNLEPTPDRKMGIHIPVAKKGNRLLSYWLSYRGGNDGDAANGLSVHFSWFDLGGYFGAAYDSRNFDAFGDTDTTTDSFVLVNTCYHLTPPTYMKEEALMAALLVQPVVCVDSIDVGSSITVTVSFLDIDAPPSPVISIDKDIELACGNPGSSTGQVVLNANKYNMIRITNPGFDGEVELRLCTSNGGAASAYFYDDYPHSAVTYGSEPAYGSYKGLKTSKVCSSSDSLKYKTDTYGQMYILLPPSTGVTTTTTTNVEATCGFTQCLANQYRSNGKCELCPNSSISEQGSTSVQDCEECPGGTFLPYVFSKECALLDTYDEITSATAWRIMAPTFDTSSGWALDVFELELYENLGCTGSPIDTSQGTPLESGNAGFGWGPEKAFNGDFKYAWGGRSDEKGIFYLGIDFGNNKRQVRCVHLYTSENSYAVNVRIQALLGGKWKNAWIEENLPENFFVANTKNSNIISMDYASQPTPTPPTTQSPVAPPPTSSPVVSPTTITTCTDSTLRFKLFKNNGQRIARDCTWVKNKDTARRCNFNGVSAMCPNTCNTCSNCIDPPSFPQDNKGIRLKFKKGSKFIWRACDWVKNKDTANRCQLTSNSCRATCGQCV